MLCFGNIVKKHFERLKLYKEHLNGCYIPSETCHRLKPIVMAGHPLASGLGSWRKNVDVLIWCKQGISNIECWILN